MINKLMGMIPPCTGKTHAPVLSFVWAEFKPYYRSPRDDVTLICMPLTTNHKKLTHLRLHYHRNGQNTALSARP